MTIVGIDPGLTGAIAWLDDKGGLDAVIDLPILDGELHHAALTELWTPADCVILEWPGVMPKNGALTARRTGLILGALTNFFAVHEIPCHRVPPGKWKRHLGLAGGKTNKDASRALATQLWPYHADQFRLAKHDGRAEAALIGHWWIGEPCRDR